MYLIEVHYEVHSEVYFQFLLHSGIYPYLNIVYVTKFQENAPVFVFMFMDIEFDSITIEELSNNTQASVRHPEDCGFDSQGSTPHGNHFNRWGRGRVSDGWQ